MGLSGAAGGAAKSLREILQERALEAQRTIENQRAQRALELQASSMEFQQARARRGDQLQEAEIAMSSLAPGVEVGASDLARVRGTPYEARLEKKATLPSRTIAGISPVQQSDVGGREYFTRRATPEEEQRQGVTAELSRIQSDPGTAPMLKRIVSLKRIGVNARPEDIETPQERSDREAREDKRAVRHAGAVADVQAAAHARHRPAGVAGMSPQQQAAAFKLQDDFARDSKPFIIRRDAYSQVAGAAADPSAAGDLSLIFGYMKILDPNSVVRETEFANAQNAAGVPDRIRNIYNRALSGERLNPTQRQDFVNHAKRIYADALKAQQQIVQVYSDRAKAWEVDPNKIIYDLSAPVSDSPSQNDATAGNDPLGIRQSRGGGAKF